MNRLAQIIALYDEIDSDLDDQREKARLSGRQADLDRIERKQRINDQAYFVLAWGQLETVIDETCREAIRNGHADRNWRTRRVWMLYNPEDKRLSGLRFEDRAALVLDASGASGGPFARTMNYYAVRNQIAHGDLKSERIDLASVTQDFYLIRSALTR